MVEAQQEKPILNRWGFTKASVPFLANLSPQFLCFSWYLFRQIHHNVNSPILTGLTLSHSDADCSIVDHFWWHFVPESAPKSCT